MSIASTRSVAICFPIETCCLRSWQATINRVLWSHGLVDSSCSEVSSGERTKNGIWAANLSLNIFKRNSAWSPKSRIDTELFSVVEQEARVEPGGPFPVLLVWWLGIVVLHDWSFWIEPLFSHGESLKALVVDLSCGCSRLWFSGDNPKDETPSFALDPCAAERRLTRLSIFCSSCAEFLSYVSLKKIYLQKNPNHAYAGTLGDLFFLGFGVGVVHCFFRRKHLFN